MLKKIISLVFVLVIGIFSINQYLNKDHLIEEKNSQALLDEKTYGCPMHSHVMSHEADSCPICGMDLVLNKTADLSNGTSGFSSADAATTYPEVKILPAITHNLGIRTTIVERGDLTHTIETIGKITRIDPMARSRITSPISGNIIKMVDKYSGDRVKQDEFLFSVASDELFSMEEAFQKAFLEGNKAVASAMIPKLVAMGLDAGQVAKLQSGADPVFPAEIYAIKDGYIFTRRGKVGESVTSSYTVFNLGGDYQVIEVTVEIFERQWDLVKEGQRVSMQLRNLPGKTFYGTVNRVDEPVGYTTRALEARLKFKTDFKGMTQSTFARVIISGKSKHDVIIVPRDAVIRTARDNRIVKVNDADRYQPVVVEIGEESNGMIEIISGIEPGARVVVSGQFLIDSESNLLSGIRRMSFKEESVLDTSSIETR